MDCNTLRNDEIQALSAIYGEEWLVEDEANNVFSITLKDKSHCIDSQTRSQETERTIHLEFRLPEEYPLSQPPMYVLSAPWMSRRDKSLLTQQLEEIYCSNESQSILYMWIEKAREFLSCDDQQYHQSHPSNELHESTATADDDCHTVVHTCDHSRTDSPKQANQVLCEHSSHCHNSCQSQSGGSGSSPSLYHGEPLTDRRSTFQAHLSPVHSVAEALEALSSLKSNKKISTATHNISAYRISGGPHNTCLQDCDDDGESHAGSRLLHLLQILEVKDVVVVVSRWYGGIQLGPDRFKHINNVARDLLMRCGYIDDSNDSNHSNQSNKHKKKAK